MTVDVERIAHERLETWAKDCVRDHATPALLLAIGHDEFSGEVHLYMPDDPYFDQRRVVQLLHMALQELTS